MDNMMFTLCGGSELTVEKGEEIGNCVIKLTKEGETPQVKVLKEQDLYKWLLLLLQGKFYVLPEVHGLCISSVRGYGDFEQARDSFEVYTGCDYDKVKEDYEYLIKKNEDADQTDIFEIGIEEILTSMQG